MSNFEDGNFNTPYGVVTIRNPGRKEPPPNLQVYRRDVGDVWLQGPALRAFKAAELRATSRRLKRKGRVDPIILTGVGYRSYEVQAGLYYGPDNIGGRYADPDGSMHVEALAIDNHMGFFRLLRKKRVKRALITEGWFFAVSGEPWHASFRRPG